MTILSRPLTHRPSYTSKRNFLKKFDENPKLKSTSMKLLSAPISLRALKETCFLHLVLGDLEYVFVRNLDLKLV